MCRFAFLAIAAGLVLSAFASVPANAQNNRTWISGTGSDTNPCSRTMPCASFNGAMSKTNSGGEVTCLDPGAYGVPGITKAITISCEEGTTQILTGGDGPTINAAASDIVYLKGLGFSGLGATSNGNTGTGIKFNSGKSLTIENCHIDGFGLGISFTPTAGSFLNIINTTISNNGLPNIGGGVQIAPSSGAYGSIYMHNVRIVGNYIGIGGSTTGTGLATITNSAIANNTGDAVSVSGNVTVRIGQTTITGNGGRATSGNVLSYGDNRINGNSPDTNPPTIALR